jgi:hypothetical protein
MLARHRACSTRALLALALSSACAACSSGGDEAGDEVVASTSETSESATSESTTAHTETTSDTGSTSETGEPPPEHFEVGVDVTDITPTEAELTDEFYLGGYGAPYQRGVAEGVHDPVFVRSMAIGYGASDGTILAIVDGIGLGNQLHREIRATAASELGLDEAQIVVAATHSHAAPDFQGLWGGVPDDYKARVIATIVDSLANAWTSKVPAQLEVASTTSLNRNRRGWDQTDEALTAVQASTLEGEPIGLLVNFAAHPIILSEDNLLVSRDFCGYAVDELEAQLDMPVLYFNGIQGDVSPDVPDGMYVDDWARAQAYGELIAQATLDVLPEREPIAVDFHRERREFDLVIENDLFILVAQAGIIYYDYMVRDEVFSVTTQTSYMRLGEQLQLVAFPGESLTRNGLPVKDMMSAPHRMVLGLATDSLGYFVPSDEWMTGLNDNYEESVSISMSTGDTTRDILFELITNDPGMP